jgi:putative PIN family toxin of toxin-antitoxin system
VRAVLDPNVIISGALSPAGVPSEVLRAVARGDFELLASQALLDELQRALAYPKLRAHIGEAEAAGLLRWVRESATIVPTPTDDAPVHSADPQDDYLIALASAHRTALVSGEKHLLALADQIPVFSPRGFLDSLPGR